MLVDIFRETKCVRCEKVIEEACATGVCRKCKAEVKLEEKRESVNSYCNTCKNRCKQNQLCIVVKCPRYSPKGSIIKELFEQKAEGELFDVGVLPPVKKARKTRKARRKK